MTRDLRTYLLVAVEATWYCILDTGEAIVHSARRGLALGLARRLR